MPAATSAAQPAGSGSATGGGAQNASRATGDAAQSGAFSSALSTAGRCAGSSTDASSSSAQPPQPPQPTGSKKSPQPPAPAQARHAGVDAAGSSAGTDANAQSGPTVLLSPGTIELPAATTGPVKGSTRHGKATTKDAKGKSTTGAARGAGTAAAASAPGRVDLGALAALLLEARPSAPDACTQGGTRRTPPIPSAPAKECATAPSAEQAVLAQATSNAAAPAQPGLPRVSGNHVDPLVGALAAASPGGRHNARTHAPARSAAALEPASGANAGAATGRAPGAGLARPLSMQRFIAADVASPGWSQALGTEVHWLCAQGVHAATLRLSPQHLGPVEVHINMQSAQVNVSFSAAHPDTRSALQQAVPTLRSMLASSGLTLGQATVQHEQQPAGRGLPSRRGRTSTTSEAGVASPVQSAGTSRVGLVDEYV